MTYKATVQVFKGRSSNTAGNRGRGEGQEVRGGQGGKSGGGGGVR